MNRWPRLFVDTPVRVDLSPFSRFEIGDHPTLIQAGVWVVDQDPERGHVWLVQKVKLDKALLVTATFQVDGRTDLHDVMLEGENGACC